MSGEWLGSIMTSQTSEVKLGASKTDLIVGPPPGSTSGGFGFIWEIIKKLISVVDEIVVPNFL